MSSQSLTLLTYESQLKNLLSALAYAQDSLDYPLLRSLFHPSGIRFDLSAHLPEHSAPTHQPIPGLLRKVRTALSGFDATRHSLSNVIVNFTHRDNGQENLPDKAEVLAQAHAVHQLGAEQVVAFTTWRVSCVRRGRGQDVLGEEQAKMGDMGDWVVEGIRVVRDLPLQGVEELYERAKGRVERGEGREGLGGGMVEV